MTTLFARFQKGLQKTATAISRTIGSVFGEVKRWTPEDFSGLERTLIESDLGVAASRRIVSDIRDRYERGLLDGAQDIVRVAAEDLAGILNEGKRELHTAPSGPTVILFVGVNGSGKTTSAGKLAHLWQKQGKKVLLAACDTFRAAAVEQLRLWAERTGAGMISSKPGADPSAVAFDAMKAAQAREVDYLIIDTAGRQQTKKNLMDELSKMRRTIEKLLPGAPHETFLTIDASLGLNAISQAREFAAAANVTGLVLTKLDGTGKGGAAAAVQDEFKLPVLFVGLGEGAEDLQPFSPEDYARAVFAGN